jgi:putative tryptophan/tyrosine transport system substrate-binding protein
MRRRDFITLVGGATAWPFAARAQEAGRTYRLGMLMPFPRDAPYTVRFLDELRRGGFIEGQNLTIEYRDFGPRGDLVFEYAKELVSRQVDVINCGGGIAIRAAQKATKTIPIVGTADDMVAEGLVTSMPRPSQNTTGVSILATELNGKRQDILIEALPGLRHMAALADSNTTTDAALRSLQETARARGVDLSINRVAKGEEITAAINAAHTLGATALNVLASAMLYSSHQTIMEKVAALRMPAIYQWPEMAEEGGFAAYGPRLVQLPDMTAREAVSLLRGAKPADIPVEQPTKFELVINLKTANALGLTVPETLLQRADDVIE